MEVSPVIMDVAFPTGSGNWIAGEINGPYYYAPGGAVYTVSVQLTPARTLYVYKSLDFGATWVRLGGTAIANVQGCYATDRLAGAGVFTLIYADNALNQALHHRVFDMATETWGADTGGGPDTNGLGVYIRLLPDGRAFVVSAEFVAGNQQGYWILFDGGWGAKTYCTENEVKGLPAQLYVDPATSLVHFLWRKFGLAGSLPVYYRTINPDTGVMSAATLVYTTGAFAGVPQFGRLLPLGTSLVCPFSRPINASLQVLSALVCADFATVPVWSQSDIDATAYVDVAYKCNISAFLYNGRVSVVWISSGALGLDDQVWYTAGDGTTWDAKELLHDEAANPTTATSYGLHALAPNLLDGAHCGINIHLYDTLEAACVVYFLPFDAPAPVVTTLTVTKVLVPAADTGTFDLLVDGVVQAAGVGNGGTTGALVVAPGTYTVSEQGAGLTLLTDYDRLIGGDAAADGSITLAAGENKTAIITNTRLGMGGGGPTPFLAVRGACGLHNQFDECLFRDWLRWAFLLTHHAEVFNLSELADSHDPRLVRAYMRLQKTGSIALPAAGTGLDTLVLDWTVPVNHWATVSHLVAVYNGTGYVPTSGDLTFRLRLNQWWVKDYAAISHPLGSNPRPMKLPGDGFRLRSNQRVRAYVNMAVGAEARLNGGRVLWAMIGQLYPIPALRAYVPVRELMMYGGPHAIF